MNQIEVAERIIENGGACLGLDFDCNKCPASNSIGCLAMANNIGIDDLKQLRLDWFKNWLKENEKKEEISCQGCKHALGNNKYDVICKEINSETLECFKNENYSAWQPVEKTNNDSINHPSHYTSVVPGIECIDVVKHFNHCRGAAIKYIWRAGEKDKTKEIEDLKKAIKYIEFEIERIEGK